ncbi:MAG: hypothetical protein PHX38_10295 [Sulfuricella sp.]|nr:hypothetical protein [Sulfuricella sp.]
MLNATYRQNLLANCKELLTWHARGVAAPASLPGNANPGGTAAVRSRTNSGFGAREDDWLGAEAYIEPMF